MKNGIKLGFIGAGNMASAIIRGICGKEADAGAFISVYDVIDQKVAELSSLGVKRCKTALEAAEDSRIVFICTKPQDIEAALDSIRPAVLADKDKIVVSIAAGVSTAWIKNRLGPETKVVRVMPNTPLMVGCGATAISHCPPVTEMEFNLVRGIFDNLGLTEKIPEDKMNDVISVNASSPAYVYMFAKAMIDGAVMQGIDADAAARLALKAIEGSVKMMLLSGKSPDELIRAVASPNGTTLKALEVLENGHFSGLIAQAMQACTRRAYEIGR